MTKIKQLRVLTPQGAAGQLSHESRYVFNYTTTQRECETSLLMPLRAESYASGGMPGPFTMNQPEGYLKEKILQRLAKFGGLNAMQMLAFTGQNQIGRLRFELPDAAPVTRKTQIGRAELLEQSNSAELFAFLLDAYLESGISGVQPKVMLPDADQFPDQPNSTTNALAPARLSDGPIDRITVPHSDLIVKASGEDFPALAVNEFLCMCAAQKAGIQVPEFWLSDDGELFVMSRFDLQDGQQIGFEDMAVLMNKTGTSDQKYQGSYEALAKAIMVFCRDDARATSLQRLFEYVAFSVMVRNGDAHLKNFGLLYPHPAAEIGPTLAPMYDVVTTSVYDLPGASGRTMVDRTMALKMNRRRDYPTRKELLEFGKLCGVAKPELILERFGDAMQASLDEHGARAEPAFLARMKREWDAGRLSLEASRFVGRVSGH